MPSFDDLIRDLEPDVIAQKTQTPHDNARGNYRVGRPTVTTSAEFQKRIADYVIYHYQTVFGGPPMPDDLALYTATDILNKSFSGGFNKAVLQAMTGEQGGIILALDTISNGFKQQSQMAYFNHMTSKNIDFWNFDQALQFAREFKAKLAPYLPASFAMLPAEAMVAELKSHIWTYISTVRSFGNLKKRY